MGLKCCHSGTAAVPARHDFGLSPLQQRQKCLPGRSVRGAKGKHYETEMLGGYAGFNNRNRYWYRNLF